MAIMYLFCSKESLASIAFLLSMNEDADGVPTSDCRLVLELERDRAGGKSASAAYLSPRQSLWSHKHQNGFKVIH